MSFPVYLYTGPEFGERNDTVKSVRISLEKKYGNLDEYKFYAGDTSIAKIITLLRSEALFTSATFVEVNNAELLTKKEDINLITSWMKSLSVNKISENTSILVLVSDQISINSNIEKLIPSSNKKIFWEMFENRKKQWLHSFFSKKGYSITDSAMESILDLVDNNTESLRNECSRFFIVFSKEHKIVENDVETLLSHNREESAFTLFDAMSDYSLPVEKRFENALEKLQKIRLTKNSSPVMVIAGLMSCFRKLEKWQHLCRQGYETDDFTLKKNGFTSKKARKQYRSAASIWTVGQVVAIKALLASIDVDIRSTGMSLQNIKMFQMLYSIILKNGSFCSEWKDVC